MALEGVTNLDGSIAGTTVYFRNAFGADGFRLWRYRIGGQGPSPVVLPGIADVQALSMYTGGRVAVISYRDRLNNRTAVFRDGFAVPVDLGLPPRAVVDAVFSRDDPTIGIVVTETASTPPRYYRVGCGPPQRIYDANRSGIGEDQLAEVRSVLIPSFDGVGIPVHLFIPNGTSSQRPRPALFVIHGGPDEHVDPRYSGAIQFLANHAFIVVVPNVRGSTGFGKRYASLDDGDWGGAHVRDIVAVAAAIRNLGFVDADNLFVMGASFGGFSVMSLVTRYPDSFDAAVNLFGFTELASFVASWPRYLQRNLESAIGFDPRRNAWRNRQVSPIYHLDRIRIPLQIHQGANDSRVPRQQSDWLVQHLRQLDLDVEYFVYPDEGHGFTRLENESHAYRRIVAFLRRHTR
jgi:dipeptidyl aminopeptidase/acylaminoacyl peptidase